MSNGSDHLPGRINRKRVVLTRNLGVQKLDLMDRLIGFVQPTALHRPDPLKVKVLECFSMGDAGKRVIDRVLGRFAKGLLDDK